MKNGFLYVGLLGAALALPAAADESDFYTGAGFGSVAIPKDGNLRFSNADNLTFQLGYKVASRFAIEGQFTRSTSSSSAKQTENIDSSQIWWKQALVMNPGATLSDMQAAFPSATSTVTMNLGAKVQTTALYGVYRSGTDLYIKLKAGYLSQKATLNAAIASASVHVVVAGGAPIDFSTKAGDENFSQIGLNQKIKEAGTSSGFSGGFGLGYKFTENVFSEVEYTELRDDFKLYSLSVNYMF